MKATLKDLQLEAWFRMREANLIKWKTRDGKVISIKEMTDEHLVHTINMLIDNNQQNDEYLDALSSIGDTILSL